MFHLKQMPQILNLPFKYKISSQCNWAELLHVFCLLPAFMFLVLGSAIAEAQPHGEGIQFSEKNRADFYFSQGQFKKAIETYKLALEENGQSGYIFRSMVRAWDALGAHDEAKTYLNEYRRSNEKSSEVWYALGYLHYIKNEEKKAEEFFKKATTLDSANGLAWNNWAAVLVNNKRYSEALLKVRTAIQTNPKELMYFFNLKKIFEEMGEPNRFEEEYLENVKQGSGAWGYGKVLARSMRQKAFKDYDKGELVKAIAGFEKILNIYRKINDIDGQVPALFSLGLLHEENGDVEKGQEFFRKVLSINPAHIQAREKVTPKN